MNTLNSFSKMRVDLAAQVCYSCSQPFWYYYLLFSVYKALSDSVSKAISLTGGPEASETACFAGMLDKFFDCVNVHNYTHGIHSRKVFQMPYTSKSDFRLEVFKAE